MTAGYHFLFGGVVNITWVPTGRLISAFASFLSLCRSAVIWFGSDFVYCGRSVWGLLPYSNWNGDGSLSDKGVVLYMAIALWGPWPDSFAFVSKLLNYANIPFSQTIGLMVVRANFYVVYTPFCHSISKILCSIAWSIVWAQLNVECQTR